MTTSRRVSSHAPKSWELGGESVIHCALSPDPPEPGAKSTVRLTHSNTYGPVDDVTFFVRLGDLERPTRDPEAVGDWIAMELVEEIVWFEGEERHRSEVAADVGPRDEMVWAGTFEAPLTLPEGKQRIELKVVSTGHLPSGVISDWRVKVRAPSSG